MSNENEREELRALAAEATPGPWSVFTDHSVRSWHPDDWMTVAYPDGRTSAGAGTNARYIAAASPDRITALLDELDAAERDRDAWKRTADERSTVAALDRAERAEAQAAAVRALHRHVGSWCEECWTSYGVPVAWPCPTIAALDTPADTPTDPDA